MIPFEEHKCNSTRNVRSVCTKKDNFYHKKKYYQNTQRHKKLQNRCPFVRKSSCVSVPVPIFKIQIMILDILLITEIQTLSISEIFKIQKKSRSCNLTLFLLRSITMYVRMCCIPATVIVDYVNLTFSSLAANYFFYFF